MRKFLRLLAAALAFSGVTGTASAQVVTFEGMDPAFLGHGDALVQGAFEVGMDAGFAGAQPSDLVGAVLNGADTSSCFSVVCPGNNPTNYLATLNDAIPFFYRTDGGDFNLTQFDASFIAVQGVGVLDTSLAIVIYGINNGGILMQETVFLPGPLSGDYSFSTYALSAAFASTAFDEVDFLAYACTTPTTCTRGLNQAQYGLDNVTFAAPVPEPSTWALLCLGLIGIAVIRRRATAKA